MEYYNVSQVRVCNFLYTLGFDKESWFDKNGQEHWRFEKSEDLLESIQFYKYMRDKNKLKGDHHKDAKMDRRTNQLFKGKLFK